MTIVVSGSIAYDYIMTFPGRFVEHILPEKLHVLSVSFLVDSMQRRRGGCAPNIAYSLALLGHRSRIMGAAGQDFAEYQAWLEQQGVDTSGIVIAPDLFTASFFVNTDLDGNQIASFYTGAMSRAGLLSFRDIDWRQIELVIISPDDPSAMVGRAYECQELAIPYIYDPSQQIIRLTGEDLARAIRGARLLIVNEYEFGMLENKTGLSQEQLLSLVPTAIVTRGEEGSTIYDGGRVILVPAAPPCRATEPTGVGDAYRAGIITGLVRGYSWETTGRIASLVATYALECDGTQVHRFAIPEFVGRYRGVFGDAPELQDLLERGHDYAQSAETCGCSVS
jgi:adenosine kinase